MRTGNALFKHQATKPHQHFQTIIITTFTIIIIVIFNYCIPASHINFFIFPFFSALSLLLPGHRALLPSYLVPLSLGLFPSPYVFLEVSSESDRIESNVSLRIASRVDESLLLALSRRRCFECNNGSPTGRTSGPASFPQLGLS